MKEPRHKKGHAWFSLREIASTGKSMEMERRLVVAMGWGVTA